jgi:arylsulfatase A-like enzyme
VRAYLASISYADEQIGRVLDALHRSPHAANTVIVLWSDHGWHLGEKGHWHKSTLWEEATRVPLVISAPGYRSGECDRPVSLLDLYPTLIELCTTDVRSVAQDGVALVEKSTGLKTQLDGVSLVPLLRDPKAEWNRPAVIEYKLGNVAVRSDRYRYIRYRDGGEELYDHRTDPHEWNNIAEGTDGAGIKDKLARWVTKQWAEPAPTKRTFLFDPDAFTWTHTKTGRTMHGKEK